MKAPFDICKDLYRQLERVQNMHHLGMRKIFDDFCSVSMASFHNANFTLGKMPVPSAYKVIHDEMETNYKDTLAKYNNASVFDIFAEVLGELALAMRENPYDYLGKIYMDTNMGNGNAGQFFTPSHICELMAQMTITDKASVEKQIAERGYIGVCDPCCGSGAMAIATAKILRQKYDIDGLDTKLFIKLTDIDYTCVKMAFINMSLLGLSACVVWGDALVDTGHRQFDTPNMQLALLTGHFRNSDNPTTATPTGQLTLF
jgi:type I restriction-modification system DNA methylase subunit